MTVSEVRKLWDEYCQSDEPHDCPVERDEEFVRCEVCDHSVAVRAKLQDSIGQIVELLLKENDARVRMLTERVRETSRQLQEKYERERGVRRR